MTAADDQATGADAEVIPLGTVHEFTPDPADLTAAERIALDMAGRLRRGPALLDLPSTEWLVPGWVPTRAVGMIYGPPGAGKSSLALSVALNGHQGGITLGGRELHEPLRVLLVMTERSELTRDRAEAWTLHTGHPINPRTFAALAYPLDLTGESASTDGLVRLLEDMPADERPHLVIVDTLAQAIVGADENSAADMGAVWRNVGRIRDALDGGSVLVVHHTGKDTTRGARGSSVSDGAVDVAIVVTGNPAGNDRMTLTAQVQKLNAGARPDPDEFEVVVQDLGRVDNYGDPVTATVVRRLGRARRRTRTDGDSLEVLKWAQARWSAADGASASWSSGDVQEACQLDRHRATDAMGALVDTGLVLRSGTGRHTRYHLTDDGRQATT